MQSKKTYTPLEALKKAEKYCVYQDRCHSEVRSKLLEWGVYGEHLESILYQLIETDFLNEERFARSYVRGKFRIKKWGKIRIEQELKLRKISPYCIKQGFKEIEQDEYLNTLQHLIDKEKLLLKTFEGRNKVIQKLMRKGYENELIQELIKR